jgi:hypothetical protein
MISRARETCGPGRSITLRPPWRSVLFSSFVKLSNSSSNNVLGIRISKGIPAIFKSLDLDKDIAAMTRYANTFKSLQDRFRQTRNITALGEFDDLKKELASLRTKLDDARMASIPVLERYFKKAQRKIGLGHYEFQADAPSDKQ